MGSATPPQTSTSIHDNGSLSPSTNGLHHNEEQLSLMRSERHTILHLGDPIRHNPRIHDRLKAQFDIINVTGADLERPAFIDHLTKRTWGDFAAIMRPFWRSGNEMAPWDRELIELLPKSVKVMASAGAGFDWVEDRCLAEHGIIYCNGAHASNESVADMALYHIISVFRHMTASSLAARSGSADTWKSAHNYLPAMSHNPRGHTLGIVGLGNIGFAIAVKVKAALGMKIIYHDIVRKPHDQDNQIDAGFYEKLDDMLPQCDCVLIATPGGPPILTKRTLSLLPKGSRVVNIARGSLVDEDALIEALESGHIDAAGLDVFPKEPHVNARLAAMTNVEMTCHTGGGSVETNIGFERLSMENCEAVLNGRKPWTAVNIQWLPKPVLKKPEIEEFVSGGQKHDRESEVHPTDPSSTGTAAHPASDPIPPPATNTIESPTANTISLPTTKPIDPPAANTIPPPTTDTPDPPQTKPTPLPTVDTHLPPAPTIARNDNDQDIPSQSEQVDSAVSMSLDQDHAIPPPPHLYDQVPAPSLQPSMSN